MSRLADGPPKWWFEVGEGDQLRMFDNVERGPIARLCHVVSTFDHNDQRRIVIAFHGIHQQWWHYEVITWQDAAYGKVWPDGQQSIDETVRNILKRVSLGSNEAEW